MKAIIFKCQIVAVLIFPLLSRGGESSRVCESLARQGVLCVMQVGNQTFPYCLNCGHKTPKNSNLAYHIAASHLKERPYICSHEGCGKAFSRSDSCKRHERSHAGERPYQCTHCGCAFKRSDHLLAHQKLAKCLRGEDVKKGGRGREIEDPEWVPTIQKRESRRSRTRKAASAEKSYQQPQEENEDNELQDELPQGEPPVDERPDRDPFMDLFIQAVDEGDLPLVRQFLQSASAEPLPVLSSEDVGDCFKTRPF